MKTNRYEAGAFTVFGVVSGIVTSLFALFTLKRTWVSIDLDFLGSSEMNLLEFSKMTKDISAFTQYFSKDTTNVLGIASFVATASYWILLIGAIVSIIISIIVLISPKAEMIILLTYIIICAFAIIGVLFTVFPIIYDPVSFTPIPIVMAVIAGIPALIFKFLG
jgi:hypothetical protein